MSYNIKSIKKKFKENGVFYTDKKLAEIIKSYIDIEYDSVYDPTCGDGGLLSVFPNNIRKYGQELDPVQADVANHKLFNSEIECGDTLLNPKFMDMKFDVIVANPPFSVKWEQNEDERFNKTKLAPKSKADYAFILHCLYMLSDRGMAIMLNFPGILYRGNSEGKIREYLIRENVIERVVRIPGGYFEDTNIETALLILRKNKKNTDVIFEDRVLGKESLVSFSVIEKNDFTLSVNTYIQEDTVKEVVNPSLLMTDARKSFLTRLEKELEFDKMVCDQDGFTFSEFVNQIQLILDRYK